MIEQVKTFVDNLIETYNFFDAENILKPIVAQNPKDFEALHRLGFICIKKMDLKNADILLSSAIKCGGGIETLALLADVKERLFEYFDAIVMYEQILELEPSEIIFEKIIKLYVTVELYENAIGTALEYTNKFPNIKAFRQLFLLYLNLNEHEKLAELCEEISSKFSNQGIAINLLGLYAEHIKKDFEEAQKLYQKASKLGSITASFDLALCYKKCKRYEEAEKTLKKTLTVYPRKKDIYQVLAEIYFIQRKSRKGYKYYLERPISNDIRKLKNKWDGKQEKNSILVYSDMSDSETIRNCRYIANLQPKCKNIIFAVSEKIYPLLNYNKFNCVKRNDISEVKYDSYVLLSELPYYLNISFENVPKIKLKSEKKELDGKYKIGLLWCNPNDTVKSTFVESIDISKYFGEILEDKDIDFYSFQNKDIYNVIDSYKNIHDLSENLETYKDYADYINSMDLIISIDSPLLHLAGTLNVPAYALLPYDCEWYWFDNDKKTEWYQSVEIFKQGLNEDWKAISKKVIEKIKDGKRKKVK